MSALAGFYHLIAFVIGAAGLSPEPWAAPFPAAQAAGGERGT